MRLHFDRMGVFGLLLTALTAPCCFPLFGFLLSALGLGSFELFGGWTMWLFEAFVGLSLLGTILAFRKNRRPLPLLFAIAGAALIVYSYHFLDSELWTVGLYTGMAGLSAASLINYWYGRKKPAAKPKPFLLSVITCPECGHSRQEEMPMDACQYFYECVSCHTRLQPHPGDCCVYCSYGTVKCPPVQQGALCC